MKKITREQAESLIKNTNGSIFCASFIKANGDLRHLNGRLGVVKGLTGKRMSYNPSAYGLLPVFDMQCNEYRMINLGTLTSVTVDGDTFSIIQ
jgi:hypothetical protein